MSTLKNARAASAPGPNGIPYRVYKNCPNLAKQLWRLIKVIWRRYRLPDEWLKSDGCFIPKKEDSKELKQFRTISLLNVEGKSVTNKAFMDDMTKTAKSVLEGKGMLQDLGELIDWARMKFKPSKSRSLILKKGKVQDRNIRIGGDIIPTIMEKPVKNLGQVV
ncbi:Hypothetical predicted protein [Mytilus galloprovincialis]|uniref:Uncharacterized protein n=1 Tax=Mytilus galloprovincialis TaxID=29158 RepID=A0A8B6F4X1_MYTGA|nr:Hypothetical predicted protein [Mytilus galloprovincialis]